MLPSHYLLSLCHAEKTSQTMKSKSFIGALFILMTLFNMLPIFGVGYFFTGDGPVHIYNASLINEIALHGNEKIGIFFKIRSWLLPNIGAHALLSVLLLGFKPAMSSKLLCALCVLLIPLGFRSILIQEKDEMGWGIFFVFMLLHHFCFYIGFMGFSMAMGLMLFTISAYLKYGRDQKKRSALFTGLLALVTAFFHMVPAIFALLYFFISETPRLRKKRFDGILVAFCLPTVFVIAFFLLANLSHDPWEPKVFLDSLLHLISLQALIAYSPEQKLPLLLSFLLLLVSILMSRTRLVHGSSFLILAGALLMFYFILPENLASGGFIPVRMSLGLFFFIVLWAMLNLKKSAYLIFFSLAAITLNIWQVLYNFNVQKYLSLEVERVLEAMPYLEANSAVATLTYSDHWLHYNLASVLGAEKPIVLMDNYEASEPHFPVMWKEGMEPDGRLDYFGSTRRPPFALQPYERETGHEIDFVVRIAYRDEFGREEPTLSVNQLLDSAFTKITALEYVEVWKRKE